MQCYYTYCYQCISTGLSNACCKAYFEVQKLESVDFYFNPHYYLSTIALTVQSNYHLTLSCVITSINALLHGKNWCGSCYVPACLMATSSSNMAMSVHAWQIIVQCYNYCCDSSYMTAWPAQYLKLIAFCRNKFNGI